MSPRCPGLHCDGCGDNSGAIIGLVAIIVFIVSGAVWLLHQLQRIEVELYAIGGVVLVGSVGFAAWFVRRELRTRTVLYHQAAREVAAEKRAAMRPAPRVVHYHQHDETHYHWHSAPQVTSQELHLHQHAAPQDDAPQAEPAVVQNVPRQGGIGAAGRRERQAIAPRKVVAGVVIRDPQPGAVSLVRPPE
jgi:hypothetical protein